jgi:putative two-component system response regulator
MKKPKRILIVEDDFRTQEMLKLMVESLGHESEYAQDGFEALAMVRLGFDLVLLDIVMPGIDGFEVLSQIRQDPETEELPVVMVTGMDDKEGRIRAFKAGANDFVIKPIDMSELAVRMSYLLKMKEAQDVISRNKQELEEMLEKRTGVLRKALEELASAKRISHNAHLETIQRLAIAAEFKDQDTAAHIKRLGHFSSILARGLDLPAHEVSIIFHATPMHDVGKLGIPDSNLLKPGKLDKDEWKVMKQHTVIGARILGGSESNLLQAGEVIAMSHHERWDGTGYPKGLAGEDIHIWGRICAVVDVFDALTSKRPYKQAFENKKAYEMIREGRGTHFDPCILDKFFEIRDEIEEAQRNYQDEAPFAVAAL